MKYLKISLLFAFFTFSAYNAQAAKIYVLFDPSCMDQLEFKHDRVDGRSDYFVYHVNIRSGEKLVLEVGEEGNNIQNFIPTPYLSCQTGGFDQGLMRRINTNLDEVYMVYPKSDKKFIVTQIKTASYYTKKGTIVSYESPKYNFRFDTEYGTIGENIAVNSPGTKVYFEGRIENDCTGAYLFRQLAPQSAYPLIDLVLIPEVGIVQERSGPNAAAAQNNSIALNRMNGKSGEKYLLEICGTEPGSVGSMVSTNSTPVTEYNTARGGYNPPPGNLPPGAILPSNAATNNQPVVAQPQVNTPTNSFVPNTVNVPVANTTSTVQPQASTHTVKSGETLYGIARQHSISVAEIKTLNGLKSNTIRRGQVLQVQTATQASNTAPAVSNTIQSRGQGNGSTLSGAPVPYAQNTERIATTSSSSDLHIVKPGETVASIALSYGYTAKRFRAMNDLGPNDYVRVGQRLKTSDCNCAGTTNSTSSTSSTTTPSVPNSYNSTGGRITPNSLTARTPITYNQPTTTPSTGAAIHNSGGLPAYSSPSIPAVTTRGNPYDAVVPTAYEVISTPQRSLSNLESSSSTTARQIPASYDSSSIPQGYDKPVSSYNYARPTASPYPTPNTPLGNNQSLESRGTQQKQVHIVADGESLYGIARRYGTTPERIRQINNLGPNDPIITYQTLYLE